MYLNELMLHHPKTQALTSLLSQLMDFYNCMLGNFVDNIFKKFFQEHYQSFNQFGSRAGPMGCPSWSGFKLFSQRLSTSRGKHAQRLEHFCFKGLKKKFGVLNLSLRTKDWLLCGQLLNLERLKQSDLGTWKLINP